MKPVLVLGIFLLLLAAPACAVSPEGEAAQAARQAIVVALDPDRHLLSGESTFVFASPAPAKLVLALNPRSAIVSVKMGGKEIPHAFSGGMLTISLPSTGNGADRLVIAYRCVFDDRLPESTVTAEGSFSEGTASISPRGVFLGTDAGWYPVPAGTPRKRTVTVSAPAGIEAVTAGRRAARRTEQGQNVSVWEEEHPVERLSLSAGHYLVEERMAGGVALYTYFSPGNSHLASRYLAAAEKYLRYYSELLGPYPYEKFAVVENFFPTGYGFPSYTLLGSTIIRLPFIIDTSLPHEIAHCWWGNGVFVDFRQGNWSEGLVTYLADHLLEAAKSSREGVGYRSRLLTDYASLVPPEKDFPLRDFTARSDPSSRAIGYGKGAMVFQMVRKLIGDDPFFRALRSVYRERLYRTASWDDFTRAFSREAGSDLSAFMAQWLNRPGGPRLSLTGVRREFADGTWRVTGTIRQSQPFYDLRVPLRLTTARGDRDETIRSNGGETSFALLSPEEPSRLTLDPDVDLFRILSPSELPATVNRVKGSRTLVAVVTRDCRADSETLRLLLESLNQRNAPVVREEEVGTSSAGRDLLVCGNQASDGLLPPAPSSVSYSVGGFTVEGESFAESGDALFLVTAFPDDPDRVAALFLPRSADAAARSIPKITHYGRYGYLVFREGENRKKGVVLPETGPGIVNFRRGGS